MAGTNYTYKEVNRSKKELKEAEGNKKKSN
jgi:hypothetical protein